MRTDLACRELRPRHLRSKHHAQVMDVCGSAGQGTVGAAATTRGCFRITIDWVNMGPKKIKHHYYMAVSLSEYIAWAKAFLSLPIARVSILWTGRSTSETEHWGLHCTLSYIRNICTSDFRIHTSYNTASLATSCSNRGRIVWFQFSAHVPHSHPFAPCAVPVDVRWSNDARSALSAGGEGKPRSRLYRDRERVSASWSSEAE